MQRIEFWSVLIAKKNSFSTLKSRNSSKKKDLKENLKGASPAGRRERAGAACALWEGPESFIKLFVPSAAMRPRFLLSPGKADQFIVGNAINPRNVKIKAPFWPGYSFLTEKYIYAFT